MKIQDLVKLLDQLEIVVNTNNLNTEDSTGYLHDISDSKQTPEFIKLIDQILSFADTGLITRQGQADHNAHAILLSLSAGKYKVIRGEYDDCGWLTGVIVTPFGKIVYG